jgi:hypothetical protein
MIVMCAYHTPIIIEFLMVQRLSTADAGGIQRRRRSAEDLCND